MDHRPMIDKLTNLNIAEKAKTDLLSSIDTSDEEIQGLQFLPGDVVLDTVTGKEVTILAGQSAIGTVQGT